MSVFESMTPAQRSLRARIAAHTSWANTEDRTARSKPGLDAAWRKFEDQVDPARQLSETERFKRAESARRAHMSALAYKSVASRRRRATGQRQSVRTVQDES